MNSDPFGTGIITCLPGNGEPSSATLFKLVASFIVELRKSKWNVACTIEQHHSGQGVQSWSSKGEPICKIPRISTSCNLSDGELSRHSYTYICMNVGSYVKTEMEKKAFDIWMIKEVTRPSTFSSMPVLNFFNQY